MAKLLPHEQQVDSQIVVENSQDDINFRHKISKTLSNLNNFVGLVEECPVHLDKNGSSIDLVAMFYSNNKNNKLPIYFIIECKDARDWKITFPNNKIKKILPWGLLYEFKNKNASRHPITSFLDKDTFYSTDISTLIPNKPKKPSSEHFYKWSTQISNNFMAFCTDEFNQRNKYNNIESMEHMYIFPVLVTASEMSLNDAYIVNPHPFNFQHLILDTKEYEPPIVRGELNKNTFLFTQEKLLEKNILGIIEEISKMIES